MIRRFSWLVAFVLLLTLADAQAAWAGCFKDLQKCYYVAARYANFWDRWVAGLDCELDFVDCFRRKVIGT